LERQGRNQSLSKQSSVSPFTDDPPVELRGWSTGSGVKLLFARTKPNSLLNAPVSTGVACGNRCITSANNRLRARLASLVCLTYSAPPSHRLQQRKRMRHRGLTLRVTRRRCRSHDASPNHSFCHARVVYSVGQKRRATAMRTLGVMPPCLEMRSAESSGQSTNHRHEMA
jgi:hypothetical protein